MSILGKGCKCIYRKVAIVGDGKHSRKELHAIAIAPKKKPANKKTAAQIAAAKEKKAKAAAAKKAKAKAKKDAADKKKKAAADKKKETKKKSKK